MTEVEASRLWCRRRLDCQSEPGGLEYQRLASNGYVLMLARPDGGAPQGVGR